MELEFIRVGKYICLVERTIKMNISEAELEKRAKHHPELHWKTSIIDLLKLVDEDYSLEARVRLAKELHWHGPFDGSAGMNEFLHEKVMERIKNNAITHN